MNKSDFIKEVNEQYEDDLLYDRLIFAIADYAIVSKNKELLIKTISNNEHLLFSNRLPSTIYTLHSITMKKMGHSIHCHLNTHFPEVFEEVICVENRCKIISCVTQEDADDDTGCDFDSMDQLVMHKWLDQILLQNTFEQACNFVKEIKQKVLLRYIVVRNLVTDKYLKNFVNIDENAMRYIWEYMRDLGIPFPKYIGTVQFVYILHSKKQEFDDYRNGIDIPVTKIPL